jgi:hypothetical protein
MVSTRNGFPEAPKHLRAADKYLFSTETVGDSNYVNTVLPHDGDDKSLKGHFFLWTHETEKLRVTIQ